MRYALSAMRYVGPIYRPPSDHYTNYLNLEGRLPADKDRLLATIDAALTWDESCFRSFFIGTH